MRDKKAIILIVRNLVSIIQKWLRRQWAVENGPTAVVREEFWYKEKI